MRFLSVSECICRIDQRAEILKRHICLNFLRGCCDKAAVFAEIRGDSTGFGGNLVRSTVGKRLLGTDTAPERNLIAVFVGADWWHTPRDNMSRICPNSLRDSGQITAELIRRLLTKKAD